MCRKIYKKLLENNKCPSIQFLKLNDWKGKEWPHYFDGHVQVFMFHAPVGNSWVIEPGHKVKVFISGFCASPEAGFKYVADVLKLKMNSIIIIMNTCSHTMLLTLIICAPVFIKLNRYKSPYIFRSESRHR